MKNLLLILLFIPVFASAQTTGTVTGTATITETDPQFNTKFAGKNTTGLAEGTNLYFTNARARLAIKVNGIMSYDSINGVLSVPISQADINKWNAGGTTSGLTITPADTAFWNKTTQVLATGTGASIFSFSPDQSTMFLKNIRGVNGTTVDASNGIDIIISSTASAPVPKARLVTTTSDVIAIDDNIVIYNGTAAAAFTIAAGSTQGRRLYISNNSTFAITVGPYTIPARSWREWVWLSSINNWFQFQSGLVL